MSAESHGMPGMRYGIPSSMAGPSHYMPAVGNWPLYPQMTMSPHSSSGITTTLPSAVDPAMLASHLSHMQIGGMAGVSTWRSWSKHSARPV